MASLEPQLKAITHEVIIRKGDIWQELSAIVEQEEIDLVIMGTHGRTGVSKVLMGSVAEKMFRHAPCPVLTVGPNVSGEPEAIVDIHTILFPTDFSPESVAAVPYAISLAQEHQARVYLLHVTSSDVGDVPELSVKAALHNLIPPRTEFLCEPRMFIESGIPAQKILELAEELAVDLIVLGVKPTPRLPRPPIIVNIPEFRLYAANEENGVALSMNEVALSMKVVVGKAYRHKTPVFVSQMKSVIFRPYWNVPLGIQQDELLPHIEKDPSYLSENSYEVVDSSRKIITDGAVNDEIMEELRSGTLAIRQRPGFQNALGLVKFEFPNQFDIYMHGTPATQLFSRSRRDFSHGCIRVEDPVSLAAWVLRDEPEWTVEKIRTAMNGDETVRVNLEKPIPVLILYGTAIVTENGEVRFFDDIYEYDAELERALAKHDSEP